jgi:subtilisin family serine protease
MRPLALLLAASLTALAIGSAPAFGGYPAAGKGPAPAAAARSRLDPRLALATVPGSDPVPVWVEFVDKGEQGPADLVAKLAAAEAALTPEARHRREKAHVQPLVDYLDLPLEAGYVSALEAAGYAVYGQSRWFNRVAVRTSGTPLVQLAGLSFVRRVAPVEMAAPRVREPVDEPTTGPRSGDAGPGRSPGLFSSAATQAAYGQSLTQLARLNIPAVHDSGYTGFGVNVCLLDNGFNWYRKHEALRTIPVGALRARDFIRGVYSVQDTVDQPAAFEHGTWTLSQLAGRATGRYLGSAFGCNAILGRTEDDNSETPIEMVYWSMGAEWADSLGADIISSSLGYNIFDAPGPNITYPMLDGHTSTVTRAAEIAAAKGILVVVSAGNDGQHSYVGYKIGAPADANGDSVLAIGALDSLGVRAPFSSKGPTYDGRIKPDLSAQGVANLLASVTGDPNTYERHNGTSFSAPLVAGLAACLIQARPTWPPVMIIEALKKTASRAASPDTLVGWGLPDGLAALRYVPDTLDAPDLHGPLSLRLSGPNPLRAGGTPLAVRVSLGAEAQATGYRVRVFDAGGRMVRDLGSGTLGPGGARVIVWPGDDAHGRALVPGLYFLALDGAGRHESARLVVLR